MKEKLSDFLNFAIKSGKIKNSEEAFKEFSPEEEWHKGKIENVLNEDSEEYNIYDIGDIVFVNRFKYIDGKDGQNHFFVIVEQNNIAVPIENFGMLISSKIEKLKYKTNIELKKDKINNLKMDSIVKTDVIYKINNKQILFKIGEVSKEKIEIYKEAFMNN